EVAIFIALEREPTSVDEQVGSFGNALVDVRRDLVAVLASDKRAHLRLGIRAGSDFEPADLWNKALDERVGRLLADWHGDRDRHTTLSGGAVGRAHWRIDRLVEVGVRHDDHMVFGAAERLR